jgi:hypothetical protein
MSLSEVESRRIASHGYFCNPHGEEQANKLKRGSALPRKPRWGIQGFTAFDVQLLTIRFDSEIHGINLRECDGDREMELRCGPYEAAAILGAVRAERPLRPLTHDAIVNVARALGASVHQITIHDRDPTHGFYLAAVSLLSRNETINIDFRPSDAICIAIKENAPIFVSNRLLSLNCGEVGLNS